MRVLLSTIGSRGDVQPLVALALELKAIGQEVRVCVPPDFHDWVEQLGIPVTPIGPELRSAAKPTLSATPLTTERRRQMMEDTVRTQFETIAGAAHHCDFLVGATALQIAAPSIAQWMGIPYVFVTYCPAILSSSRHAPPVLAMFGDTPAAVKVDYSELWAQDAQRWNDMWSQLINSQRELLGLPPVSDVRSYVLTDRPWLAAERALGAVARTRGLGCVSDRRLDSSRRTSTGPGA